MINIELVSIKVTNRIKIFERENKRTQREIETKVGRKRRKEKKYKRLNTKND